MSTTTPPSPNPQTYTIRARVNSFSYSTPGWGIDLSPGIELGLQSHDRAPVSFRGTLGLPAMPAGVALGGDHSALYEQEVEITVRLLTKRTRVVPWKAEEVPLGMWVRLKGPKPDVTGRWAATFVGQDSIYCDDDRVTFCELAERYEHSVDGGKTWKPAGRVEEVSE